MTDVEMKSPAAIENVVDIFSLRSTQIIASKNESMIALREKIDRMKSLGDSKRNFDEILNSPGY